MDSGDLSGKGCFWCNALMIQNDVRSCVQKMRAGDGELKDDVSKAERCDMFSLPPA